MANVVPPEDTPIIASAPVTASKLQRFLRKARGQIEKPTNQNLTPTQAAYDQSTGGKASGSDAGSGYGTSLSGTKQASGEAYAEGGAARFYAPIQGYEGRHRWDPTVEWTEAEEKKLVRKVCLHSTPSKT